MASNKPLVLIDEEQIRALQVIAHADCSDSPQCDECEYCFNIAPGKLFCLSRLCYQVLDEVSEHD